ncbi:IS3 family transposase [Weissella coleopterorum]|uniref:IS3 family transposase n=1 Tax=Weissella coleopterorum TaxID=2714949 RepID=A0A6G8B0M0_9LACO|nr:IS3 family transposase [Weissella coleopterorum]
MLFSAIQDVKSTKFKTEYSYRRITILFKMKVFEINHKRVLRIMR